MKRTLLAAAFATTASAAAAQQAVVTVVTSAEPQTQLMAMVLTMQAVQHGSSARVLLCGPGGDLGLADAPAAVTAPQPPRDMSPQGLMKAIMAKGATVEVCAIYLPGKGLDAKALLDGAGVAQPPAMAAAMLEADARVWSF
jgi:intracellular sulfur oxidation DsrE/DsrF family protein